MYDQHTKQAIPVLVLFVYKKARQKWVLLLVSDKLDCEDAV
jgi:hypothetical protein